MHRLSVYFILIFCYAFSYAQNSIQFIQNKGQVIDFENQSRRDILFTANGNGTKVYLRKTGISYVVTKAEGKIQQESSDIESISRGLDFSEHENKIGDNEIIKGHRVDLNFESCDPQFQVETLQQTENYFNYYSYANPNGLIHVPAFGKIIYRDIYKNTDVVFYSGSTAGLKYDIIVKPGGDPKQIQLKYSGAEKISLEPGEDGGKIKIETSIGQLGEWMPKVYQNINGTIVNVNASYTLNNESIGFQIGDYNSNFPLIIDPWITYLGGSDGDVSGAIDVDNAGNAYVGGSTSSVNFPSTPGAFQVALNAGYDCSVSKFDPNGSLIWSTFYGGTLTDMLSGIALDQNNNVAATGYTCSLNFPVSGAFQSGSNASGAASDNDAFIFKLDPNGVRLWATYYGGHKRDNSNRVATDNANNIIITGSTYSNDFPVTPGAIKGTFGATATSDADAFVVKFDQGGARLWSTYYGGLKNDMSNYIATDNANNILFTGYTNSDDFTVSAGAYQGSKNTGGGAFAWDSYVVKLNSAGGLVWSTYLGGGDWDQGYCISADNNNDVIVNGCTHSNDFPVSAGAYQAAFGGGPMDVFISKFSSGGNLLWSTYFGGTSSEYIGFTDTDDNNNIYLFSEWEESAATSFTATVCAFQKNFAGVEDQFILKLNSAGNPICSSFLGGSREDDFDFSRGGIVCYGGNIYTCVYTLGNYPVTSNAYQANFGGLTDIAVAKLCGFGCGDTSALKIDFNADNVNASCSQAVNFTSTTLTCDIDSVKYAWSFAGGTPATSTDKDPGGIIFNIGGNHDVKLVVTTPCGIDSIIKPSMITIISGISLNVGNDTSILIKNSVQINPIISPGMYTYTWTPAAGLSCTDCLSPLATPDKTTTYYLSVTKDDGCTATDSITIYITSEYSFYAPNAFTPNGDGINDTFFPQGIEYNYNATFMIFDRWGNLIYQSHDLTKAWDGRVNGRLAQIDVYVWRIKTHDMINTEYNYTGHIALIK